MTAIRKTTKKKTNFLRKKKKRKSYPDMPEDPETLAKIIFDVADVKAFGPGKRKPRIQ